MNRTTPDLLIHKLRDGFSDLEKQGVSVGDLNRNLELLEELVHHQQQHHDQCERKTAFLERENKRVREHLEQAQIDAAELNKSNQQLEVKLQEQNGLVELGTLAAGIAHEIKNPLNFVTNFSELASGLVDELRDELEKLDLSSDTKELLLDLKQNQGYINEHGERAIQVVQNILAMARGERQEPEAADLNKIVDEHFDFALDNMRRKSQIQNLTVHRHYGADMGLVPMVSGSLGRVIINLVQNAIDAMQTKLNHQDYTPELSLVTRREGNSAYIAISDNGVGLSEEECCKVFNTFYSSKKNADFNLGLGLALCKRIVNVQHGGSISVNGVKGEGATFKIRLPLKLEKSQLQAVMVERV